MTGRLRGRVAGWPWMEMEGEGQSLVAGRGCGDVKATRAREMEGLYVEFCGQ